MMKNSAIVVIILLSASLVKSQNIIINGNFENGILGWDEFYTRNGELGTAVVTSQQKHSGAFSLEINYPSNQDWSFNYETDFAVTEGE
jgi:hypothetical protein